MKTTHFFFGVFGPGLHQDGTDFTKMVLAVQKHLEITFKINLNNPKQPLLLQFFQKFTLWGSPCSCPTPWCLCWWNTPRWSWPRDTLKWPLLSSWKNPEQPLLMQFFQKIHSLGKSLVLPYTLVSLVLDFTQMVLFVLKTLKWPL